MRLNGASRAVLGVVLALAGALLGAPLAADEPGISVLGTGEARAKPDRVEIEVRVAGTGELTSDALVKYADSLKHMLGALKALKMKNLSIEQQSLAIGQAGAGGENAVTAAALLGQSGENPAGKIEVEIARKLRIVLTGIDKLTEEDLTESVGRLVDTVHDAGARIGGDDPSGLVQRLMSGAQGQGTIVTFVVSDPEAARQEAYSRAFAHAEANANRLAALAKVSLGPVVSIEEAPAAGGDQASTQQQLVAAMYGIAQPAEDRLTSKEWGEIPVHVALRVRFGLSGQQP